MAPTRSYLAGPRLRDRLRARGRRALANGTLRPFRTRAERVTADGIPFIIRVVEQMPAKPKGPAGGDPFGDACERELLVGSVSPTHVALLNKFNVLDEHLLLVTRIYEHQEQLLTPADLEAFLIGLQAVDGLAFYNGGEPAGASQPHKHLQLVPLPLASDGDPALPVAEKLAATGAAPGDIVQAAFPFPCPVSGVDAAWLEQPAAGAVAAHRSYLNLLEAAGLSSTGPGQSAPYNFLLTRRWMWLVPRIQSHWRGIEVNGLGFAGALLAKDSDALAILRDDPLAVLTAVTN